MIFYIHSRVKDTQMNVFLILSTAGKSYRPFCTSHIDPSVSQFFWEVSSSVKHGVKISSVSGYIWFRTILVKTRVTLYTILQSATTIIDNIIQKLKTMTRIGDWVLQRPRGSKFKKYSKIFLTWIRFYFTKMGDFGEFPTLTASEKVTLTKESTTLFLKGWYSLGHANDNGNILWKI